MTKGYSEIYGARPLRRVIQDELEHRIAEGILSGEFEQGSVIEVSVERSEIRLALAHE